MPKVQGTYSHSMTKSEAIAISKQAVMELLSAFEATDTKVVTVDGITNHKNKSSVEFSCKSRGFSITGEVLVKENEVDVTVVLPMMAIAFKGRVKAAMDKHVPKHLERNDE